MVKPNFKPDYIKKKDVEYTEFIEFVTRQPCITKGCGRYIGKDKYGVFRNDPSHIKSVGMGGANQHHIGNIVSHCRDCHRRWHDHGPSKEELEDATLMAHAFERIWVEEKFEYIEYDDGTIVFQ